MDEYKGVNKLKIVITGLHGYISNSLKNYINGLNDTFDVELLNLRSDEWKKKDFSNVDCIVHTTALVHKNEKEHSLEEYRQINTILTEKLANKCKKDGIKQFIFLATEAIYGAKSSCFHSVIIDNKTPMKPVTKYGITKLEAEKKLLAIQDDHFKVAIIRPPMVYGANCTGNYVKLRNIVLKFGILPTLPFQKSFIYIDNLCSLICCLIKTSSGGIYCPQNLPTISTYEMMKLIALSHNKKYIEFSAINPLIKIGSLKVSSLRKAFGSLKYSEDLSRFNNMNYQIVNPYESIVKTEKEWKD